MAETHARSQIVVELAEEFIERYRRGERPPLSEYMQRHPELADEIREVFPALALMENIALDDAAVLGAPASAEFLPQRSRLGEFRIVREIARGGMGVVYEAEQESLGRRVALKVLPRPLVQNESRRQRFEREAKAAAKLHHTNIVPVFAVGAEDGHSYYAMQYIHGQSLDEVLEELKRLASGSADALDAPPGDSAAGRANVSAADVAQSLITGRFRRKAADSSPPTVNHSAVEPLITHHSSLITSPDTAVGRLSDTFTFSGSAVLPGQGEADKSGAKWTYWQSVARIGVQAAEALDYAHRQGILHRDVKPANLLLDVAGSVWVADFGLAKAEDQQNLTQTGDIIGTLRYMAPEMFEGRTDARSDVCSLGLTLYELLALRPAFDETDRARLLRQVMHESPPPLRVLNRDIPRDLMTIVHKAIDRDPAARYQTAADLAADLEHYLNDEPIRAKRISPLMRLTRWCRRNPAVASLTAAVVLLLVLGVVGLTISNLAIRAEQDRTEQALVQAQQNFEEAERQRKLAGENAEKAEQAAGEAKANAALAQQNADQADAQRQRAEGNLQLALDALDKIYLRLAADHLPELPELSPEDSEFLEAALPFYEQLAEQKVDDSEMQFAQAHAHSRVGNIYVLLRDRQPHATEAAVAALSKTVDLYRELADRFPENLECRHRLARAQWELSPVLTAVGSPEKAEAVLRECLELLNDISGELPSVQRDRVPYVHNLLGVALRQQGKYDDSEQILREGLAWAEEPVKESPDFRMHHIRRGDALYNLAKTLEEARRTAEAEEAYRQSLNVFEEMENVASHRLRNLVALASLLKEAGRTEEAEVAYRRAAEQLLEHGVSVWHRNLMTEASIELAKLLSQKEAFEEAEERYRSAIAIARKSVVEYPENNGALRQLTTAWSELAQCLRQAGRPQEAEKAYRDLIQARQQFIDRLAEGSKDPAERRRLADTYEQLGRLLLQADRLEDARDAYDKSASITEQLFLDHPEYRVGSYWWYRKRRLRLMGQLEAFEALTPQQKKAAVQSPSFDSWLVTCLSRRHAAAHLNYRVRIETPGTYRLYLRWDGHSPGSDSLHAAIVELLDGPGGEVADWYTLEPEQPPGDYNFATHPWQGNGTFEEQGSRRPATWTVPQPGEYTVRIFMREDGAAVDALILQLAELPAPRATGRMNPNGPTKASSWNTTGGSSAKPSTSPPAIPRTAALRSRTSGA